MEWTTEHDMLFCRKVIAFDLYQYKPGSKERRQFLDRIKESLDSTKEPCFKVDQKLLRGRIKKVLKTYVEKRNKEMQGAWVEADHKELDNLLLDMHERKHEAEVEAAEV